MVCGASFAQKTVKLSGIVVDEKGKALPFAVVRVLNSPDTTVVKSGSTNVDGEFIFDQLKGGNYQLLISMMGYKARKIAAFALSGDLKMADITMESDSKQLKEVSVQGRKPYI